jgi:dihydroneopterin aldolase
MICDEKQTISFPNLEKDGILVIPRKKWSQDLKEFLDYKNLSQFTKNAPEEQQQEFWKKVANKLAEELEKNPNAPRWLNASGLGVKYLHIRIDEKPKYYNHDEYKKWK